MAKKLIVANWKMNPATVQEAEELFVSVTKIRVPAAEVVVCPPFPFLGIVNKFSFRIHVGAQDVSPEKKGAHTGEVSAEMLRSLGATHVIIGHSERRQSQGETDQLVNRKVRAALKAGLVVILCVGEPKQVRAKGFAAAKRHVRAQLAKGLKGTPKASALVLAYEPIWAIGSGKADRPEEAALMASAITADSGCPVIYGGSVTSQNARGFLQYKEIHGALVGGASLKAGEFEKIINSVTK